MHFWSGIAEIKEYLQQEGKNKIKAFEAAMEKLSQTNNFLENGKKMEEGKATETAQDFTTGKDSQDVSDGVADKVDDNGNIYLADGKLQPNITYQLNGNVYETDEQGRIKVCIAKPERSPENPRDFKAQQEVGGQDRLPNDQGGHIVGRDLNGDGGIGNLVAMDSKINQSDYKRMENDVKKALGNGGNVTIKTEMTYTGNSERPDKITTTINVDGKVTVYKFDNNLDGSLINEVPVEGKETVQETLRDTKGEISSIKEEYNKDGELVKTTVTITYTDADGVNHRLPVTIENNTNGGGNK